MRDKNCSTMRPFLSVGGTEAQSFFRENGRRGKKTSRAVGPLLDRVRENHVTREIGGPREIQKIARRTKIPLRVIHSVPTPTPDT